MNRTSLLTILAMCAVLSAQWADGAVATASTSRKADFFSKATPPDDGCYKPKYEGGSGLAGGLCSDTPSRYNARRFTQKNWKPSAPVTRKQRDLPANFFWGDIHGVNYLTVSRNQHIPHYCGSCWAFGTTSAISDRIKIMRRNQFPEVLLAPQVLIDRHAGGTCQGGRSDGVYRYMAMEGLPDETCKNYQARDPESFTENVCQNCNLNDGTNKGECNAVEKGEFALFKISDFGYTDDGSMRMYEAFQDSKVGYIMDEIYRRGPVSCALFATDKFDEYGGGVFAEKGIHWHSNHIVSLVGWGEEAGIKYWIGRNSWGTYWGENGFFRIVRGDGRLNLGIENSCTWAEPVIPKGLHPRNPLPKDIAYGEFLLRYHEPRTSEMDNRSKRRHSSRRGGRKPAKKASVAAAQDKAVIIKAYDVRNVKGLSYASINRNQNNPLYCESSWAQAATSALNDRFALLKNASHPEVVLSVQALLNCATPNGCMGGSVHDAYEYIKYHSLPDESCSPYEALQNECSAIHTCKSCWPDGCYALHEGEYTPYTITTHGNVSGDQAVMQEIQDNGPVACRICDSRSFLSYKGGIFKDSRACDNGGESKKYVVLSGWGEKDGVQYWIGRNSWGTYWGESGWFKVEMGKGDMGITKECHWAKPIQPDYRFLYKKNEISAIARIKSEFKLHRQKQATIFSM